MKARIVGAVTIAALVISAMISKSGWTQDLFSDPAPTAGPTLELQERALEQQNRALAQQTRMLEKQMLEKQAIAIIDEAKKSALTERTASDAGLGGYGPGYGLHSAYGMGSGGNRRPLEIDRLISELAAEIRHAKNDEARADATNRLRDVLDQIFEQDMEVRAKELEGISARLQKLQSRLDRRREKKQEIVDLQVKVLLNEAEGLGFYSQPKGAEFLSIRVPAPANARTLQMGDVGVVVEAVQRTLNARIEPSPNIRVDGDFGPETEDAVKKFQSQNGLKQSGVVDAATWKALGPLVMTGERAPEPVTGSVLPAIPHFPPTPPSRPGSSIPR